ncbi:MAG: AAA family ATPase [Luteolibacter sp.]|uniref:AAA family ATPase n=1 Tax=Luteolibacter sp. TaxID=1962973 RepID=UPI003264D2F9
MPALLVVLCGPNGAGKSTFFEIMLKSRGFPFVNADMIAAEKFGTEAATHALTAAKLADAERRRLISEKTSFIMETVLSDSGGNKLAFFRDARNAGYFLEVFFIGLDSPETSAARVRARADSGGHDVPLDRINARYPRTLSNLRGLCDFADSLTIFDNSSRRNPYRLVARLKNGGLVSLCDVPPAWTSTIRLEDRMNTLTERFPL